MGRLDDLIVSRSSRASSEVVPSPSTISTPSSRLDALIQQRTTNFETDPYRGLKKVESIGGPRSLGQRVLNKGIRLAAIPAQAVVRGLTLRNLELPIPKGITEPITGAERILGDVTEFGVGVAPFFLGGGLVRGAGALASRLPILEKGVALASRLPTAAKV